MKLAFAATAAVVCVPLILLVVLGALVGIAVFIGASILVTLAGMVHSLFRSPGARSGWDDPDDGRRNVRVIPPQ